MRTSSFFAQKPTGLKRVEIERVIAKSSWGIHRSIFSGKGIAFRRFRPYTPLDRPTAIDDMASHRLSQDPEFEPYVRETYTSKKISALVLLDVGKTMQSLPAKEERAAILFWFLALSAFKYYDDFRVITYAPEPLGDSDWINEEEKLAEFISSYTRVLVPLPRLSRFTSVYSYLPKLELYDTAIFIISDFAHSWKEEPMFLRRLGGHTRNLKLVFCAIDEWEDFVPPSGYAIAICDPRTGRVREYSPRELREKRAAALVHLAQVEESLRPLGATFIRVPLLADPLLIIRRAFRRMGFR